MAVGHHSIKNRKEIENGIWGTGRERRPGKGFRDVWEDGQSQTLGMRGRTFQLHLWSVVSVAAQEEVYLVMALFPNLVLGSVPGGKV